jgi:hypothetical protein
MKRLFLVLLLVATACGNKSGNNDGNDAGDDTGDGNNNNGDGSTDPDGAVGPPNCDPDLSKPQCSNCIDDDQDGFIDQFDIHCTGPLDNDESSFKTGIPGDNIDAVKQDCFFDGNSGAGDDGCDIHVCCLLGAQTKQDCPIGQNQYNPDNCPPPLGNQPLTQQCIDFCGQLTPPGCDCFGCCTLCNPTTNECYDIITNPNISPNCDIDSLADPAICKPCTKVTSCGNTECGGQTCILCPGQDPNDLPPECNGMTACPEGQQSCAMGEACPANTFCASSGCCVGALF